MKEFQIIRKRDNDGIIVVFGWHFAEINNKEIKALQEGKESMKKDANNMVKILADFMMGMRMPLCGNYSLEGKIEENLHMVSAGESRCRLNRIKDDEEMF